MYDQILPQIAGRVTGIVHFGAHLGQEAELYERCGIKRVAWVEPNPDVLPRLREKVEPLGHLVIPVAVGRCGDAPKMAEFHVSSNSGESSSLFQFGTHSKRYPSIRMVKTVEVPVWSIGMILREHRLYDCNFWYFDIQGGEVDALHDARQDLAHADFVYAEVQFEQLYERTGLLQDIDHFLADFTCLAIMDTGYGWGEAFYERIRNPGAGLLERVRHGIRA